MSISAAGTAGGRPSIFESIGATLREVLDIEDSDSETSETSLTQHRRQSQAGAVFMDAEEMKKKVRANLFKTPYDVSKFYKPTGLWRTIATDRRFDNLTLAIISCNALWIGIDTDGNTAEVLIEAHPVFQIAEHFFCMFFAFEWFTRFMSFRRKRDGLRDTWFVFDSILVFMMVMETWVFTGVLICTGATSTGGMGNASVLRMARLARLSRMARMARLLRAMPELMILIKGISAATRSVFFTLVLLALIMYIFSIAFTQLTVGEEVHDTLFSSVSTSMFSLLCNGVLQDDIAAPLVEMASSPVLCSLYLLFVLFASVTVMNMLIGVLCEVVTTVATVEKEAMMVTFVRGKLQSVLEAIDEDGSGYISKSELTQVLSSKELVRALNEVGVDVEGLTDFVDVIFADESEDGVTCRELTFPEFMAKVLCLRGSNKCTVKDVVEFHKIIKTRMQKTTSELRDLIDTLPVLNALLAHPDTKQVVLRPTGNRTGTTHQLLVIRKSDKTGMPRMPNMSDIYDKHGRLLDRDELGKKKQKQTFHDDAQGQDKADKCRRAQKALASTRVLATVLDKKKQEHLDAAGVATWLDPDSSHSAKSAASDSKAPSPRGAPTTKQPLAGGVGDCDGSKARTSPSLPRLVLENACETTARDRSQDGAGAECSATQLCSEQVVGGNLEKPQAGLSSPVQSEPQAEPPPASRFLPSGGRSEEDFVSPPPPSAEAPLCPPMTRLAKLTFAGGLATKAEPSPGCTAPGPASYVPSGRTRLGAYTGHSDLDRRDEEPPRAG